MIKDVEWFAGIDWASYEHQACLLDGAGTMLGERAFRHGGAGLAELCDWLLARSGGQPHAIAVAIEVSHGPVIETLLERGFSVHALNPKQLDRFRDRFSPAGAKDDRRDAYVLAHSLRTDAPRFRQLATSDPSIVELRAYCRLVEELQQDRTRLANRLREQLWRYYPQVFELTDDLTTDWFLALWLIAPTPEKARRLRPATLTHLFTQHGVRRLTPERALVILRQPPLVLAPGTLEAACAHIRSLLPRLRLLNQQWRQAQRDLDTICDKLDADQQGQSCEPRDVTILRSLPGTGRIVTATLLAEACEPLKRRDYHALRCLSGVAPVTRRSGKQRSVSRRYACQRRLQDAVYHWALAAIQRDPACRQRYDALRQRGHRHARALRTIADRLLAIACAMLRDRTLYDPDHPTRSEGCNAAPPSPRTRAVIGSPACTAPTA